MSTSATGVQKPERFDLYVEKLRSLCEMHNIPTGSPDHLSGFITRLDEDRRFAMDFWAFVGKLSSREGGELNDDQTIAVVLEGITSRLPDENDDNLRPQINHLRALLSGVDTQRPEPQLPALQPPDTQLTDQPAPSRSNGAVPIDHRRRRFSITAEDAPPALETQMLQTVQRLEAINRQLKESLISIDQRINTLEARLTQYPADTFFAGEPAPPAGKKTPPVASPPAAVPPVATTRHVVNPLAEAYSAAAIDKLHRAPFAHRSHVEEPPRSIQQPVQEQIKQLNPQSIRNERYAAQPTLPLAEPSTQVIVETVKPVETVQPKPEPNIPQPNPALPELSAQTHTSPPAPSIEEAAIPAAAHATPSVEEPALHKAATAANLEEHTAPSPGTRASLTQGAEKPVRRTPVQRYQFAETNADKVPTSKTQVPGAETSTQSWKTEAKPLRTISKQRLVLDPIAQPAPSSESSSARKISKSHTRPIFAGYESSSGPPGKKVAAALAIAVLLAGSAYAWHRYSALVTQLVHPTETTSSTTQNPAQPAGSTADDSTTQSAQSQSQADQSQQNQAQANQTQLDQSPSGQPTTDQPSADQPTPTAATPQPETPADSPRKPALDRNGTKAAAAAEDLFANANWSAIKVPSEVMQKNLIVSRVPNYPDAAKASRVKGTVIVQALIQKDGSVGRVRVLQGDSRLRNAAMDAIFRQKYRPYSVNGTPVDVITTISLDFAPPQ